MRRLMALILFVIGAALLAGSTGASLAAFSQPVESRSLNAVANPFSNDPGTTPALFTGLHISKAPSFPLDPRHASDPAPHFPERCLECHASIGDYALCHLEDAPGGEHPDLLSCAACHQPPMQPGQESKPWQSLRIDHSSQQFVNCLACHSETAPANHYPAQCSACHTPPAAESEGAWSNGSMDHQAGGLTDCQACHGQMRPANHFAGQCSACHNTAGWSGAKYNHQGAHDCQTATIPLATITEVSASNVIHPQKPGTKPTLAGINSIWTTAGQTAIAHLPHAQRNQLHLLPRSGGRR